MCKSSTKSSNKQAQLELFQFSDLKKPVEVSSTAPNLSSFGGLTLLKSINESQNFIHCLSTHVREWRNENLLVHGIEEMMTQRIFQIASGYEDALRSQP